MDQRNARSAVAVLTAGLLYVALVASGGLACRSASAGEDEKPKAGADAQSQPANSAPGFAGLQRQKTKKGSVVPSPKIALKPGEVPQIEFESPLFDFGTLYSGNVVQHDFWFTNPGSGPLEILLVKPDCGCTTSETFEKVIAAGESGRIPIKLDTSKLSGAINKTIAVHTNAPGKLSQVDLSLTGHVKPLVVLTPKKLEFGSLAFKDMIGKTLTKSILIESKGEEPLKLGAIHTSNPVFKCRVETIEEGRVYRLHVTLGEPLRTGSNGASLEIDTNIEAVGTLVIPAGIYLRAPVEMLPSQLTLSSTRKINTTKGFSIQNNGTTGIEVSDVKFSNPMLKGELEIVTPGFAWKIRVDVPKDYHPPVTGDTISVRTTHPEMRELVADIVERAWVRADDRNPENVDGDSKADSKSADHAGHDHGPHDGHDH